MSSFEATPAELQICGAALTDVSGELRAELNALRSEMDALFGSGWVGQAANGFARGWEQWQAGAHDVLEALQDMASLLTDTGRNYRSTDRSAAVDVNDAGYGL